MLTHLKKYILWFLLVSFLYAFLVLSYVWWQCYQSNLPGGKYGPLDAYRHTLASAVVAYTSSPLLVKTITVIMERKHWPIDKMDEHNNAIGIRIGLQVHAFSTIENTVKTQITYGKINATNAQQTTWLARENWKENRFW